MVAAAESLRLRGVNVEEKETAVDLAVRVEESGGGRVLDWREIGVCWRVAIAELKEWLALFCLSYSLTHSFSPLML